MKITFYKNRAENNKVNKTGFIDEVFELDGTLRNASSVITPSIIIEISETDTVLDDNDNYVLDDNLQNVTYITQDKLFECNYCYIEEFKRYYFITNITSASHHLWVIDMDVDVLMTYKDKILDISCMVARNENDYHNLLVDDKMKFLFNKNIELIDLDFRTTQYFLNFNETMDNDSYNCIISVLNNVSSANGGVDSYDLLPAVNTYAGNYQSKATYYCLPPLRVNNIVNQIYKNDTVKSFIKNIIILPFTIDGTPLDYKLFAGDTELDPNNYSQQNPIFFNEGVFNRFKYVTFQLPNIYNFYDIEPYTEYEIYIPFKGFTKINLSENAGCSLTLFYNINFDSGQSNYILYNDTKSLIVDTGRCELGYRLSLDSSNALELQNQKNSIVLNTTLSGVASAIAIAGGIASMNPIATMGGVLSAGKTIGSYFTETSKLYNMGSTDVNSDVLGLLQYRQVFIKKISNIKIEGSDNASLYGKPLYEYRKLSLLSGLTIVDEVHLEGFDTATLNEINSIETLLKDGVIL